MEITGVMIYYYYVCKRKLWYFINQINMEQNNELVSIGKSLDETSYSREKKGILIDNTINIDFIKNGTVLHEVKKTKAVEEAGIWQIKYYMYYLQNRGVDNISAQIDYPLLKQTKHIYLEDDDKKNLDNVVIEIQRIIKDIKPPNLICQKICKKCAYFDLCYV